MGGFELEKLYNILINNIRSYFKKNGISKAVIGLSGGVDSSLSAFLVAQAIGSGNLYGLIMPEKGVSSKLGVEHGVEIASMLGIDYSIISINNFLKPFSLLKWKSKLALMNTKARVRMNILYNYANTHNALVVGTSNKSEMMLGYFTKYGDGASDLEVIGSLYKTEVFELAKFLGLPSGIIEKKPSAELFLGHTDEKEIGGSYFEIDKILKGKNLKSSLAKKIKERIKNNKHKTEKIMVIKSK